MLNLFYYVAGAIFILSSAVLLASNRKQRDIVFSRLGVHRRRTTGSYTPPRSLSPSKQGLPPNEASSRNDYGDVFPPSRRHMLSSLSLSGDGKSGQELSEYTPDYSKRLPDKESPDMSVHKDHVSATGFTLDEIERLGKFPDYAELSGVPLPQPYPEFDIATARPRPYRPLRWAYHQTMSLTKMEPDWWLELDSTYVQRVGQRRELFEKHGPDVLQTLPGSEIAAKELMEMCLQFLCARYPQHFRLDLDKMIFHNDLLKSQTDLQETPPMQVLLQNVPEDFAIMIRNPETGIYSFRGGMICSSLSWSLGTKIGLQLHEIHGPIPDYKEKMQFSMDRYFAKKPTDKAIQRGSWGLEIDEPLYMPPGDPHEQLRGAQDPAHTIERCRLRVDWQTLRRLPLSGAVVFNFKGLFTPVTEFRDEPYIPSLTLKVLREGKKNLMEYKGTWHTEHIVIPALEEYEREQIAKGLIEADWEPHTLHEAPYFPGWEEKWHRQQGF